MRIIRELHGKFDYPNPVVTIGNFDGVHIGHQKIFKKVVEKARKINGTPIAITFDPHPVRVLAPERGLKILTTFEDKANLISSEGIKVLICIGFSKEFAKTDPDDFIRDILVNKLGVKWVIVGHNYAFGKGKKGTTALLRRRGKKYGFDVSVVRYAKVYDDIVSSSRVRSLLLRGRVCEASRMLGRAYHIGGMVIKGAGRGASLLHTPTANITTPNELVPKEGVYAVKVSIGNRQEAIGKRKECEIYDGVANIGKNPTFGDVPMSYEVHIFNFDKNLLGEKIKIHFIDRIRDEKKFSGISELEENIRKDIEKAKQILAKRSDRLYL
ncbi:MAG: bifunctional riboflavin kinase/FAD synthetase [Nitrospiraceae bacterium]|jgi:riboflavin kinase/FMN adenylyltransferase|nr:bifunctional riboflavin kinase/FAD synthetase [Nitrospirota bacterium]MDA8337989.1 bifunctional riboflavin kinase/FAD synthetase [Nitrospiraceae bacterium]